MWLHKQCSQEKTIKLYYKNYERQDKILRRAFAARLETRFTSFFWFRVFCITVAAVAVVGQVTIVVASVGHPRARKRPPYDGQGLHYQRDTTSLTYINQLNRKDPAEMSRVSHNCNQEAQKITFMTKRNLPNISVIRGCASIRTCAL